MAQAVLELYERGYLDEELANVQMVYFSCSPGEIIFTSDTPVTTLDDIRGLKIAAFSGGQAEKLGIMGTTVEGSLSPMDLYPAIQKGTVDGVAFGWLGVGMVADLINYATVPGSGTSCRLVVMNKDTYNELPADVQEIVDEMISEYTISAAEFSESLDVQAQEGFLAGGGQIMEWRSEAMAEMEQLYAPIWEDCIVACEAEGLPARQLADDMYQLLLDLGVEDPALGYTPSD
jgi:TRAP-type C4-dicarboxylate transport system substrate-binding protein